MPPLIELDVSLNDTITVKGIYDSGSNVTLVKAKLLRINNKNNNIKK